MKKISLPKSDAQVSPKSKKARLPLAVKIIYGVAAACAPLYLIFLFSEGFSDFFNRYISSFFRAILAHSTSFIPFSVAEFALLLLPVWVFLITRAITRRYGESLKELLYSFVCVFSMVALIFSSFTLAFAPAYRGSTLDKKLCIERQNVSARELYDTAMILSSHLAEESKNVNYALDGFSVMPYDYSEMNKNLLDAYGNVCDEYAFIPRLKSRLKPVMLSEPMSYTHITGVYTFFTGESNINVAFPDYTIPFTAAHELAHQRGIARENEANFVAFLVCSSSEDDYVRYCAYLNMYEYVASALASADPSLYSQVYATLPTAVRAELDAYSRFYEKYRNSAASEVSGAVNNAVLIINGTEGTKSYGMVVDLAVAYYKDNR
ncbi:MAG: DUF3810 domain-containing protein [Ruminococcaceae bacterium]|nr:DUF3810 domain-containing protein [Oscillospiraceae bacterium]